MIAVIYTIPSHGSVSGCSRCLPIAGPSRGIAALGRDVGSQGDPEATEGGGVLRLHRLFRGREAKNRAVAQ